MGKSSIRGAGVVDSLCSEPLRRIGEPASAGNFGFLSQQQKAHLWEMWRCRPLWKEWSAQARNDAAVRPALHTSGAEFTGVLAMPVGSVGKRGRMKAVLSCFSNCPDSHSPVLENLHHRKPRSPSADGRDFPLFRRAYGCCCF